MLSNGIPKYTTINLGMADYDLNFKLLISNKLDPEKIIHQLVLYYFNIHYQGDLIKDSKDHLFENAKIRFHKMAQQVYDLETEIKPCFNHWQTLNDNKRSAYSKAVSVKYNEKLRWLRKQMADDEITKYLPVDLSNELKFKYSKPHWKTIQKFTGLVKQVEQQLQEDSNLEKETNFNPAIKRYSHLTFKFPTMLDTDTFNGFLKKYEYLPFNVKILMTNETDKRINIETYVDEDIIKTELYDIYY